MEKYCNCCKKFKPISEFGKCKTREDGLQAYCIICSREKSKKFYYDHKDKYNEKQRIYYNKNKEKIKLKHKEYDENNRDKLVKYRREWRWENRDMAIEYGKKYRDKNYDKFIDSIKRYNEKNPEKKRAHIILNNSKRKGLVVCGPCQVCGNTIVEAHHEDYTKPLDVIWLCKYHHVELHRLKTGRRGA